MRKFNTAGPIRPALDYHIPPLDRLDLPEVLELIRDERYFVLHAPRQTGKTSTLLALRGLLNSGKAGKYRCAYINVEPAQTAREDVGRAMGAIASRIAREARYALDDPATADVADALDTTRRPDDALGTLLETWARSADAPLVLLIDEIDAMVGDSLVSVLRQLRAGYAERPDGFPQSVVLCGVRDVRDYRIRASSEKDVIAGGSAFNIKARSLRMGDFTRTAVETLLGQHTAETGQGFAPGAVRAVGADPGAALARQRAATTASARAPRPRELTWVLQDRIPEPAARYVRPDGGLDMDGLLAAFQDFFRQNSEHWIRRAQYTEAGPQLVLQAFVHRVVNATGRIERKYALGSRRVDLLVVWPRERGREDRDRRGARITVWGA